MGPLSLPPTRRATQPQQSVAAPPSRAHVVATMRSAVISESSPMPPEFVITVTGTPMIALEFCATPDFTPATREAAGAPLAYFHTGTGLREAHGDKGLRVAAEVLQPGRGGVRLEPGPAGTVRLRYGLHPAVWRAFALAGGTNRVYYRALTYHTADAQGRPAEPIIESWRTQVKDVPSPPFIFIRRAQPTTKGDAPPPAAHPSPAIGPMAKLRLDGARLTDGRPGTTNKTLRGVNISQLQYLHFNWGIPFTGPQRPAATGPAPAATRLPQPSQRWLQAAGITQELIMRLRQWGCGIIRVPVNQDWILNGLTPRVCEQAAPMPAEEYLRDLDQLISWAVGEGVYTLLCLHSLRKVPFTCARGTDDLYQGHLPDELSTVCWALLGERYRDADAVLFDLFNEPHAIYSTDKFADCYTGIRPTGGYADQQLDWYELWHDQVRALESHLHDKRHGNPDRLLFVTGMGGAGWGSSLRHMPVRELRRYGLRKPGATADTRSQRTPAELGTPLNNLVYCTHLYADNCADCHPGDDVQHWLDIGADKGLGTITSPGQAASVAARRTFPVFATEWGPAEDGVTRDGQWAPGTGIGDKCAGTPCRKPSGMTQEQRVRRLGGWLSGSQIGATATIVGWTAWAVGDRPFLDLRDQRELTALLSPAAAQCSLEYWGDLPTCNNVRLDPVATAYLTTDRSGRALTAWGDYVKSLLAAGQVSRPTP